MKKLLLLYGIMLLLGCQSSMLMIQNLSLIDIQGMQKREQMAGWLYHYDAIAWWTSDSIANEPKEEKQRLSGNWFCYPESSDYHAYYGYYDTIANSYVPVFHYIVDSLSKVTKASNNQDTLKTFPRARALQKSLPFIQQKIDSLGARFNQYVHIDSQGLINVWFLPAIQPNGFCIWGNQYVLKYDSAGNTLLSVDSTCYGLRGLKRDVSKSVWIDNSNEDLPTVGSIFFLIQHRKYFKSVYIKTKGMTSSTMYNEKENGWAWFHIKK